MGNNIDGFINKRPVVSVPNEHAPLCTGCCYSGDIQARVHCSEQVKWLVERGVLDCSKVPVVYKFSD